MRKSVKKIKYKHHYKTIISSLYLESKSFVKETYVFADVICTIKNIKSKQKYKFRNIQIFNKYFINC
jgi:hypothetical protein